VGLGRRLGRGEEKAKGVRESKERKRGRKIKRGHVHFHAVKGRDPESAPWYHLFKGDRINDHHLRLEEKRQARSKHEKKTE
jgi:hypothetical protein